MNMLLLFHLNCVVCSVVPELSEQLGEENLRARPEEEATWTAAEGGNLLHPAGRHYGSNFRLD